MANSKQTRLTTSIMFKNAAYISSPHPDVQLCKTHQDHEGTAQAVIYSLFKYILLVHLPWSSSRKHRLASILG